MGWVIMGATYDRDLGDSLKFFVNGQLRIESDRRTSTQAIVVPNAAAITAAGSVQAAVDAAALNPFDVQDGTIKINMRAGIGDIDDAWGIEAWVTNLTNEVTRGVTFNTVLRSGSRSTFIQEPRNVRFDPARQILRIKQFGGHFVTTRRGRFSGPFFLTSVDAGCAVR